MDKYDVTLALWDRFTNGRPLTATALTTGVGQGGEPSRADVDWYDCVKWCNARSEMDGLTPAYYTNAEQTVVYRTGDMDISNPV